jgi:hypothetical protein
MDLSDLRTKLILSVIDIIETMTGEELLVVVTRNENDELTAQVPLGGLELLSDRLNGWVDNSVWNAPKSL